MRIIIKPLAPENVDFKPVLVDGSVFLRVSNTERRVDFSKYTQHRTIDMAQSRGECNALAKVPQKVDVARCNRIVFEGHTGRRFISVQRMRSNDTS